MERHKPFGHTKEANIERRTEEEEERSREPSFERRMKSMQIGNKWMQHASKHPGKTREYLKRAYGNQAFNRDGTIKEEVLEKAISNAKHHGNTALEKKLVLARTYKKYAYA